MARHKLLFNINKEYGEGESMILFSHLHEFMKILPLEDLIILRLIQTRCYLRLLPVILSSTSINWYLWLDGRGIINQGLDSLFRGNRRIQLLRVNRKSHKKKPATTT